MRGGWIGFAAPCMGASGTVLLTALKNILMGTAYAESTGIGAVGTFAIGIFLFDESAKLARFFFVGLILVGFLEPKLATAH